MSYVGKESGLLLGKVPLFLRIYKHKTQRTKQNEHGKPKYQQISVEGCTCSCGSRGVDEGCLKDPVVQEIRETLPDIDLIPGIFYFIIVGVLIFTKNPVPYPDDHSGLGSIADLLFQHRTEGFFQQVILIDDESQMSKDGIIVGIDQGQGHCTVGIKDGSVVPAVSA